MNASESFEQTRAKKNTGLPRSKYRRTELTRDLRQEYSLAPCQRGEGVLLIAQQSRNPARPAAIDVDGSTGNHRRLLRRQKNGEACNIFRHDDATHRHFAHEMFGRIFDRLAALF